MPITDILIRNAQQYPNDVSLVELNPEIQEHHERKWKEYELVEPGPAKGYRFEMTWKQFNDKANKVANTLLAKGITKGSKAAVLLMNCIEWLPIYLGY
jgi:acyl-CoA synthetase (AMP-forming)/AMP-acid ligase II